MDEIRSPTGNFPRFSDSCALLRLTNFDEADTAGAVYIDRDFQALALDRLRPLSDELQPHTNPERVAWSLARGEGFRTNKHDFGSTPFEDGHGFRLGIPLRDNVSSPNSDVEGREMVFTL